MRFLLPPSDFEKIMSKKSQRKPHSVRQRMLEARRQRDREQQRKYWLAAGAVVGILLLILAAGIIDTQFIRPAQAIAEVDGEKVRTDTYQKYVRFIRGQAMARAQQLQQQKQQFGDDPSLAQFRALIDQNIQQALAQAEAASAQALEGLIDNVLIKKEAAQRSITVSEQELNEEIERIVANSKNYVTAPQATATAVAAITATATAVAQPTPTPSPTPTTTTPLTPTPSLTPTVEPTPVPPHIMTPDEFKLEYQNLQTNIIRGIGWSEEEYKEFVRVDMLRRKLQDIYAATVPTTTEQVHVRHILTDTKEQADAILLRLKNGEPFEKIAAETSKDTSNKDKGGDLGWFPRGQMVTPFEDVAFALKTPNELSQPVSTTFGYHIIQLVEGPAVRELDAALLRQKQNIALTNWLNERKDQLRKENKLQTYYSPSKDPK
jgi:hypothetical protein